MLRGRYVPTAETGRATPEEVLEIQLASRDAYSWPGARLLDREAARFFLWVPVLFGSGAALYFGQGSEPKLWVPVALLVAAWSVWLVWQRGVYATALSGMMVCVALGFSAIWLRTYLAEAPVVARDGRAVGVIGWLEKVSEVAERKRTGKKKAEDHNPTGKTTRAVKRKAVRMIVRVMSVTGHAPSDVPKRIRVRSNFGDPGLPVGSVVKLNAVLMPPGRPVMPGGYDFARRAYFDQVGAVGFALAQAQPVAAAPVPDWRLRFQTQVQDLRRRIGVRISRVLPGDVGALARALIVGDRSSLSQKAVSAFRDSGLAHVLAISGLHMSVMAGSLFWGLRMVLALFPSLVLRYRVDKLAAALALLGAFGYLLLSGASVSTQRAFVMVALMFLAIMVGRPALSLRNVALAALVILIARPESVLDIGFQMSFAAVVGLISVFEYLKVRRREKKRAGLLIPQSLSWFGWPFRFLGGIMLTTLVASTVVAPIAMFHFHKLAQFSLASNLIAIPLVTLLIMPLALATLIAMPLGLEHLTLVPMGYALQVVLMIGETVSSWQGSVLRVPSLPQASFGLIVLGGLWVLLWQERWRWLGIGVMALGGLAGVGHGAPDIYVGRDGRAFAVRDSTGLLVSKPERGGRYALRAWLAADGDDREPEEVKDENKFRCDKYGCTTRLRGLQVTLAKHPRALREDCRRADVVIARFVYDGPCPSAQVFLDKRALERDGAHTIYLDDLTEPRAAADPPAGVIDAVVKTAVSWLPRSKVPVTRGAATGSKVRIRVRNVREWQGERPWSR